MTIFILEYIVDSQMFHASSKKKEECRQNSVEIKCKVSKSVFFFQQKILNSVTDDSLLFRNSSIWGCI